MTEYCVGSIMRTQGPVLSPDTPVRRAVAALIDAKAAAAAVCDEAGALKGILTQKDCFRPVLHASYYREWRGRTADYMTRDVVCIDARTEVIRAAEQFLACPHRVLPVLERGIVAGLLHRSDVLALLVRIG